MGNISGGPDQGVGFLDVLFYGQFLVPILRPLKNFLSKALGKMPGGGFLRGIYSSGASGTFTNPLGGMRVFGKRIPTEIKWPQAGKFLKRFRLIAAALSLFNDSMSMIASGFKPYQAILVAIARTAAKLGMFAAYSVLVSQTLGGVFAGVGAIAGAIAGGVGGPPGAIAGGLAGAGKGYAVGTAIGPYLAFLSLLFPDQTARLTGGLLGTGGVLDPMAIEENIDRTVTNQTSKLIGVDDETRTNYMTNEFSSDNIEVDSATTTDDKLVSVSLSDNIVPFKTNKNGDNLAVDQNVAYVIDTTLNNNNNKSNFVGSGQVISDNTPTIKSSNNSNLYGNDMQVFTGLKLSAL